MKVLLINPPRFKEIPVVREVRCAGLSPVSVYPPLKLLYIASFLKKEGKEVFLIDGNGKNLDFGEVREKVKKINPDVVIFSSSPTTMTYDCQTAKVVKSVNRKIVTVLDDSHIAPVFPEKVLKKFKDIDILIKGESEKTAFEITQNLASLKKVKGIAYRNFGKIIDQKPQEPLDVNKIPPPAYDLVNLNNYYSWTFGKERKLATILTSVSCPYSCSFCIVGGANIWRGYGKKWRAKKPEKVIEEIDYIYKNFKTDNFYFFDETFTVDKERVKKICQLINKEKLEIKWSCNSRVDTVDSLTLEFMKKAGCWNICFGIESGSQDILDSINKKTNLNQAINIFQKAKKIGIKTSASFMIGLPKDSKETLKETLNFAKKLNPDRIQFVITTAYPGTELYDYVKKEKLLESDYNFSGFDAYGINNEAVLKTKYLTAKEICSFQKKMYLSFYLRLSQILKLLSGIKSLDDFLSLIKLVKSL